MDTINETRLAELTPTIMGFLDGWELSSEQIFALLGFEGKSRDMRKIRQQGKSLPWSPELCERADHLMGIEAALRTSYPKAESIRSFWLRQPHRRFNNRAPLQVMLEEGVGGLVRVRVEVDCAYGWSLSETNDKTG